MAETTETERKAPENGGSPQQAPGNQQPAPQGGSPNSGAAEQPAPKKKRNPIVYGIAAVLVVLALIFGVRFYLYNRVHVTTDDAYVTGNLVNVSPLISGTLTQLTVDEGDFVKRGQLIARIDPSGSAAALRQAQANYTAALSQVPQAERNLAYQEQSTKASIMKAQAALDAQHAKSNGAQQQVVLTSATVRNQIQQAKAQVDAALAQAQQAQAQVKSAIANRDNFVQAVQTARLGLSNFEQQIVTAQRALQAAQARSASARAEADRATRDEQRYRNLYDQDAVSAQAYDSARAQALNDQAAYQASVSDTEQAQSQVESARRAAAQSRSSVVQAQKSVDQAQAQVNAAQKSADAFGEQVTVARAGLGLAQANSTQVGIQQSNLLSTNQQTGENEADVATAKAGQEQVDVRKKQIETYKAQAAQARAALTNAEITLQDTYIFAPTDGEVVRKDSNVGTSMSPGSTIVTVSQSGDVWIMANYKETQLQDVRVGQPAEINVDAFKNKVFKGRVQSITGATGAATSLLPPDNATGNFTKVVQRIPVRIELIPTEGDDNYASKADIANLRQGMSVSAAIDTSNTDNNQAAPSTGDHSVTIQGQGSPSGAPVGSSAAPPSVEPNGGTAAGTDQNGAVATTAGGSGTTGSTGTPMAPAPNSNPTTPSPGPNSSPTAPPVGNQPAPTTSPSPNPGTNSSPSSGSPQGQSSGTTGSNPAGQIPSGSAVPSSGAAGTGGGH